MNEKNKENRFVEVKIKYKGEIKTIRIEEDIRIKDVIKKIKEKYGDKVKILEIGSGIEIGGW